MDALWVAKDPTFLQVENKDSDRTTWMRADWFESSHANLYLMLDTGQKQSKKMICVSGKVSGQLGYTCLV